jgi:hypothetical protein
MWLSIMPVTVLPVRFMTRRCNMLKSNFKLTFWVVRVCSAVLPGMIENKQGIGNHLIFKVLFSHIIKKICIILRYV